jgi:hypothetical protein
MTSDPDLEAKTRLSQRPILDDSFLGKGVALWRGEVGSCPDCPKVGGGGGGAGGTSICHLFLEKVKRFR